MTESAQLWLKVFSGPHLGAEIPLESGQQYTLGSNDSCDLILRDTTIASRHLRLDVTGGGLGIKTLDAPVVLVGQPHASVEGEGEISDDIPGSDAGNGGDPAGETQLQGEHEWQPLTPLMVGTTCLAWTHPGTGWGNFSIAGGELDKGFFGGESTPDRDGAPASGEEAASEGPREIKLPGYVGKILKGLGLLVIFLFLFGPCMGTRNTYQARDMEDLLADADFDYLSVDQTEIGVTVLGTVETQADRRKLWQLAGHAEYPVFIDVKVREERAYAVKVALSVRGLFPEVELEEDDIHVKGYMRDKLIEGAAKIWIRKDIAQVGKIDSTMVYAFQVWPVLKDRLLKYKLDKAVVIRFHPGLVQVEGELDFDQRQTLETVKAEVCKALESPIAFWDTLTAPGFSPEWNASLNSSLKSAFSPDAGLAQLFLDSQSAKGIPAFTASTPEYRVGQTPAPMPAPPVSSPGSQYSREALDEKVKNSKVVVDSQGNQLAVLTDKDGNPVEAVLLDRDGNVVHTPAGNPVILPVIKDKQGRVVKDKAGNPVFAQPLMDDQGNPMVRAKGGADLQDPQTLKEKLADARRITDETGRNLAVVLDEKGEPRAAVLLDEDGNVVRTPSGQAVVVPPLRDAQGNIIRDGAGNPVFVEAQRDAQGNYTMPSQGVRTLEELEAAVKDAEKIVDDQGHELAVLRDDQGNITEAVLLDKDGNIVRTPAGAPVVLPVMTDKDGNVLVDEKGQPRFGNSPGDEPMITGPVVDGQGNVIRDGQGNPVMGRTEVDEKGQLIRDAQGNPVILGAALDTDGKVRRDKDGNPIPLTVARDAQGRVVRDAQGNPYLLPAMQGKSGRIIRDAQGTPVAPRVITGAGGKAVFDKDGNLILDKDANAVLESQLGGGNDGGSDAGGAGDEIHSNSLDSSGLEKTDKDVFGSGTAIADKKDKARMEDPLRGMTLVSITLEPIPFVSMKDGQKFFTGGRLPSGYVIRDIGVDRIVVEKAGKKRTIKMRQK
ncbi:MAG: type III secretion system inner membrane ring subunit SctD [Desulfobacterales bacterium]|nr:type III secretion system inner membrane ring subunit SctD [Desulfobacterales bacterium]